MILNEKIDFDENFVYFVEDADGVISQLMLEMVDRFDEVTGEYLGQIEQYSLYVPANSNSHFTLFSHEKGVFDYSVTDVENECSLNVKVNFSEMGETQAVITGGSVAGEPVFIEESYKDAPVGEGNFYDIAGVYCPLFAEFELPLGTNLENVKRVRAKFVLNKDGELNIVFAESLCKNVTVTLYDGSILNYKVSLDNVIPFDASTWKIIDGYAYYLVWQDNVGYACPLSVESGTIYSDGENLEVKRVALFDSKPFTLSGDNYNVTGTFSLAKDDADYKYILTYSVNGRVEGKNLSANNSTEYFWQSIYGYVNDAGGDWCESISWTLQTEVNENGITVVGFLTELYIEGGYADADCSWTIRIQDGSATLDYVEYDENGMPVFNDDYSNVSVPVREFTEADRVDAITITHEIFDENNNASLETVYVHLHKIVNSDGTLLFEYVSYTKVSNPAQ